jgi:hypothetical protein
MADALLLQAAAQHGVRRLLTDARLLPSSWLQAEGFRKGSSNCVRVSKQGRVGMLAGTGIRLCADWQPGMHRRTEHRPVRSALCWY